MYFSLSAIMAVIEMDRGTGGADWVVGADWVMVGGSHDVDAGAVDAGAVDAGPVGDGVILYAFLLR